MKYLPLFILLLTFSVQAQARNSGWTQQVFAPEMVCMVGYTLSGGRCVLTTETLTNGQIESNGVVIYEAPASQEPEYIAGGEDVLLVHGFSPFGGHNCQDYFFGQHAVLTLGLIPRTVKTIGYYGNNTNCDVNIDGYSNNTTRTRITEIAAELASYIMDEYPPSQGKGVDIVAHSMGGIVVRKMIQDWGSQLNIDQVVTLGTPHGGYRLAQGSICPDNFTDTPGQCKETAEGSAFMALLDDNPQSRTPTSWTLIATDRDEAIGGSYVWEPAGTGPGTDMGQGDISAPTVSKYTYLASHFIESFPLPKPVSHGSLVGMDSISTFRQATYYGSNEIKNPTDRVLDVIRE